MSTGNITINLKGISANWTALNGLSAQNVETAAVVKADGYGLDAGRMARTLYHAGARQFFVAAAEEAAAIRRELGDNVCINVFSGHMRGDTEMIHDLHLIPMLNSFNQLTRHLETLPGHPFGVQLDTGMNRLGMEPSEWEAVRDTVVSLKPDLVMSHLACAGGIVVQDRFRCDRHRLDRPPHRSPQNRIRVPSSIFLGSRIQSIR